MAGRLLVDTSVSARELAGKEVSFSLTALALSLLGQHRTEVQAGEVAGAYGSADTLMKLVRGKGRGRERECSNGEERESENKLK